MTTAFTSTPLSRWRSGAYALVCVAALALSGCTFADGNSNNGKAAPPNAAAAAAAAAQTGPTPMDTFRTLAPPEGMKFTPLFSVPAGSDDARFARLEQAVQTLKNDFDTVTPTLVRLAAIEKDIRDLVGQLRTLTDAGPIVESVPVAAVETAPVTSISSVPPAAAPPTAPKPTAAATVPTVPTTRIPGEDIAGGTEAAQARTATAVPKAPSSPVAPEAAPTGKLPPDGAASPASKPAVVPPAGLTPAAPELPPEPLRLTPPTVKPAPQPVNTPQKAGTQAAASPAAVLPQPTPTPSQRPPGGQTQSGAPVPVGAAVPPKPVIAPVTGLQPEKADDPLAAAAASSQQGVTQDLPKVTMGPVMGDVRDIRVGDHIDKTRVVLDVSGKAPFKVSLDASGKRVFVELPQYAWKTVSEWRATSAALVAGYKYENGLLVLDLLAPATLRNQESLPASNGSGQRIVLDLFSSMIHTE